MLKNRLLNASLLTLAICMPGTLAHAQVDEIIVTAQKKNESLQDVPIAVTAFNSEALEEANIVAVEEIALRTPNFTATRFNIGEPQFFIRGVGSTSDSAAGDPSVALFVDEVYVGRAAGGTTDLFDLQSIEVLRGPQGTLYGRNAAGGAINITTRKPTDELFSEVALTAGNYDLLQGSAVVNTPLNDHVNAKISANYRETGGYVDALRVEGFTGVTNGVADGTVVDTGENHHEEESLNLRAQFTAKAGPANFLLSFDFSDETQSGNGRVGIAGGVTAAHVAIAQRGVSSVRDSFSDSDTFQDNEVFGTSLRVDYDLDDLTFTSISAYRTNEYNFSDDLGGLPAPILLDNFNSVSQESSQISQEFRLASSYEGPINWIGGLYFFDESVDRFEAFDVVGGPVLDATGTPIPVAALNFAPFTGNADFTQDAESQSYAVFGQLNWNLTEALKLTAGARISHDKKSITASADGSVALDGFTGTLGGIPLFPGSPYAPVSANESWTEPTWRLAMDWKLDDDKLIYASYDRGYKSGTYGGQAQSPAQATTTLDPEIVDSFEIGAKTRWLDDRLQVNAAIFSSKYKDLQVFELIGLALNTANADADISGLEVEAVASITSNLQFGGTYSYLDTEFTSDATGPTGTNIILGNQAPRSPESKVGIWGEYGVQVGTGKLSVRGDYNWSDEFFYAPSNAENTLQPSFEVVNARIAYDFNENYEISLWGKNLTDEEYTVSIVPFSGSGFGVFAPPTTYGITLNARFD